MPLWQNPRPSAGDAAALAAASNMNSFLWRGRQTSRATDASSDTDIDPVAGVFSAKMDLTPAESTPPQELDPSEVGMTVGLKKLYAGKEDKRGRYQWTTTVPENLGRPAEDVESEKWAVVARYVPAYNDPKRALQLHTIVIQSPVLKEILQDVLAGYPGVTIGLKRLEFSGRFEPLIHRWAELEAAIVVLRLDNNPDAALKLQHGEVLVDLIGKEFKHELESSADMKTQGVITYDLFWTIFQPGCHVYTKAHNQDQVYRLVSARYGVDTNHQPVFCLTCQFIDYDGIKFGTSKMNILIRTFEGTRPIMSLSAYPLDFHSGAEELKAKLTERGSKVEGLTGSQYRVYEGFGFRHNPQGIREPYMVKGRIVVDSYGWNEYNPNFSIFVTRLATKDNPSPSEGHDAADPQYWPLDMPERMRTIYIKASGSTPPWRPSWRNDEYDDGPEGEDSMPVDGMFGTEEQEEAKHRPGLTEDQKLICTPVVRGYALREKVWLNFFVNAVKDITFSDKAFESLVLPKNQKELILGFIRTQSEYRSQFDDHIQGKGRGIITLLYGPPGVGKTLTAESVAEEMKVPLFMMSAGDLGLDPSAIEAKLTRLLDMCTRWNAILLLDEADVFLEQRSLHELERNKLVSIFLRVLEYYQGIMFLTTNRVQTFDAAFQSRIHISIVYPDLDAKSRHKIWGNFLKQHDLAQAASRDRPLRSLVSAAKLPSQADGSLSAEQEAEHEKGEKEAHRKRTLPHAMSEKDIHKLADLEMNGRQIKNILKTAQLLASQRGEGLSYDHVKTVMDVTQHLHNTTADSERMRSSVFS